MTNYFLDTSALIKRYIVESGASWILKIIEERHNIFVSQITPVEVISGVARLRREGVVSAELAASTRTIVNRHVRRQYITVNFTHRLVFSAQKLLETHPLRAYDAVQLASALEAQEKLMLSRRPPLIFVSADKRLLTAAGSEGLAIYEPT